MDGYVTIGTNLDTSMVDKQIVLLENKLEGLLEEYEALEKTTPFEGQTEQLIKLGNEIDATKNKLDKLKNSQKQGFGDIGKELDRVVKKVGKWGLAIFGIRSAYNFIRSSITTLAGQNEELAAKIDAIKGALAQSIAPIVERIVNLAYQLVQYLGYVVKTFTGRDIFAEASKSLQKGAKAAKEMKQQLSGVDELNVISDTKQSSGAGGSGDFKLDTDLDVNAIERFAGAVASIATAIGLVKLGFIDLTTSAGWVKFFGIALTIYGIVEAIMKLIDYINDPSWSNFGQIIEYIGLAILGVAVIIGSLPVAIAGAIVLILGILAEFWEEISAWLDNLTSSIYKIGEDLMDFFAEKLGWFSVIINTVIGGAVGIITEAINFIKHILDGLFTGVKQLLDGIIKLFKGDFKGGIISIGKGIANALIGLINGLIDGINLIASPIRGLIVAIGKVLGQNYTMDNIRIPNIKKLAKGGIINLPGRGVPVGNAIAGERGMEGVIPLTDAAQMELLGEAIGKYININTTIPVYVGNRQIAREIRQINANEEFASNN